MVNVLCVHNVGMFTVSITSHSQPYRVPIVQVWLINMTGW